LCILEGFKLNISIFGLTVIEGYYTKINWKIDGEEIELDGFVIINGEEAYLNSITKQWFLGNTLYGVSENGNPIASIKIANLNEYLQNRIKKSNIDETITLRIFLRDLSTGQIWDPPYMEILGLYQ